jgi:hypothetical protein
MNILNYKKHAIWLSIAAVAVVVAVVVGIMTNPSKKDEFLMTAKKFLKYKTEYVGEDLHIEDAIVNLVEGFGNKLQRVSLQAPKNAVIKSIQENYSEFVSQALIDDWKSDPFKAPGRLTSSPWPERIEILSIEKLLDDSYQVNGKIIEITSVDMADGGFSASCPLNLLVKKTGEKWLIDNLTLGEYEKNGPAETDAQEHPPFEFARVKDFALRYGYDWGIILASNKQKTELLLYNEKIDTKDDLKAKRIELNHESGAEYAEDAYLPEELQGYSFGFKYGDENQKEHLLAVRSRVEPHQKKLYSDLLVIDKDNLEQMTILQFYAQGYDPSTGRVPQGTIPTIIDFTVDLIDDYIVYHDTDLFWKVQDVRSGEIYASEENETSLQKVEICYQEEEQDRLVSGKYIYILKYIDDNSVLAFDTTSKKFSFIK